MTRKEHLKTIYNQLNGCQYPLEPIEVIKMFESFMPVGRIAASQPKVTVTEKACYYEGRTLAQGM